MFPLCFIVPDNVYGDGGNEMKVLLDCTEMKVHALLVAGILLLCVYTSLPRNLYSIHNHTHAGIRISKVFEHLITSMIISTQKLDWNSSNVHPWKLGHLSI